MRYLIGFLGVIAIIILIIVLIVRGGGGGGGTRAIDLADYITSTSQVRFTADGPVNADQTHNQIRITVNQNVTTIDIIKGYEGTVIASRSYDMNPNGYANFMLSLKRAGYTLGNTNSAVKDERGYCATGNRYIYELYDDGKQVQRFWSTSCRNTATFKGKDSLIQGLFRAQVPDFNVLTRNVNAHMTTSSSF